MSKPSNDKLRSLRGWRGFVIIGAVIALILGLALLIRKLRKNSSAPSGKHGGFSLLETLLAVALISLIGTGVVKAIETNARANGILDEKVQAVNLVTAYLENIRQLEYDDDSSPYSSVSAGVAKPPQYAVAMDIMYSGDGTSWSTTNNSGAYHLQRITISVSRTNGDFVLSACTFRTTR